MAGFVDLLKLVVDADVKGAVSEFKKLETTAGSSLDGVEKKSSSFGQKFSGGLSAIGSSLASSLGPAAIASTVGAGIGIAIKSASDLNEQVSKTQAVFGSSSGEIMKWADTAATSLGQSKTQALEAASSFGNMFLQLGLSGKAAVGMSTAMTGLASDFASFFNTDPAQALEAISSAFRGEFDAVQRFVPTITAAAVEHEALKETLKSSAKELTNQEKAVATYNLLLNGAGQAAGDFERTSGSLANQQRILKAQLSDTAAEIGNSLIPALLEIAKAANAAIGWLDKIGTKVQELDRSTGRGEGGLLGKITGLHGFDSKSWSEFFGFADGAKKKSDDVVHGFDAIATSSSQMGAAVGPAGAAIGDVGRQATAATAPVDAFFKTVESMGRAAGPAATSLNDLTRSAASVVTAQDMFMGSADSAANAISRQGSEFADLADSAKKADDALNGLLNAQLALAGSVLGVSGATRDFNKAVQEADATAKDSKATSDDKSAAYDRETQAAIDTAQATVTYAEKQAEAQGKTLDAKAAQDILIGTLYNLAGQMNGPSKDAVIGLIGNLQTLGAQKPQPTLTVNDQASGPIAGVKDGLDGLARRSISIPVSADTSSARSAVNAVIDGLNRLPGNAQIRHIAVGSKNFAGGIALVGERGPELAFLPKGTMVKTAAESKHILDGPSALPMSTTTNNGGSINIVFSGLVTDEIAVGREIKRVLARAGYSGVN